MPKNLSLSKIIFIISFFSIIIQSNENPVSFEAIIRISEEQGYNLTNPEDKFFNDICQYYSSEYNTDVSLEYRRKFYFYPNGKQYIINNNIKLNQIFSEPKRNNIFSCFKYYLDINHLYSNISLYFIIYLFFMQFSILLIILCGKYQNASGKTPEKYNNYIIRTLKERSYKKNKYIFPISIKINTTQNENINTTKQVFNNLREENNNNELINNNFISDEYINQSKEFKDNKENKIINEENKQQNIININKDEIYTFGGFKLNINDKEESYEKEMIDRDKEKEKEKQREYVFNQINNIQNTKNSQINNNKTSIEIQKDIDLTKEELFYSGYSVVMLQDKRSFKEIYFDILSHCQIIYYCFPNFFIYEEKIITMIYYSLKLFLYFIIIIFLFNDFSIINKIYDNKFTFFDSFLKSLIATIIVNIISQFIFILTNSKRLYIKYTNKIKKSLFGKKRIVRYILTDIIVLINKGLFWKLLIFFFLDIFIFILAFFFSICFCIAYKNTEYIIIKCVLICILISQISPFFLVLIPAKLRKKSIETKNMQLFQLSKVIDYIFLP